MAYLKFTPIDEIELGRLPDELMPRWKKLIKLREQIEGLETAYDNSLKVFFEDAKKAMEPEPDHSRDEPQLVIDEIGNVFQSFCACPLCQSKNQQIPLGAVLQALQAEEEIDEDGLEEVRKKAAEERVAGEATLRKRLLIN